MTALFTVRQEGRRGGRSGETEAARRRSAPESVRLNTMHPSQNPIASSFVTQTIYDRAHRHLRRVGLLLMMPLLALGVPAVWFNWINAREHRVTHSGWVVIVVLVVCGFFWARAARFPCPKCGRDLVPVGRRRLPRVCPGCGLSLDTAWQWPD